MFNSLKSCHIQSLLTAWYSLKEQCRWVLASISRTQGSAYLKAGTIMLISDQGHSLGMLSGGCLEADVKRNAQKVISLNKTKTLIYQAQSDADNAHLASTGCGGEISVLLQVVSAENDYQDLVKLYEFLKNGQVAYYQFCSQSVNRCLDRPSPDFVNVFTYQPTTRLALFGIGLDTVPLAHMAMILGWQVYLFDHRPNRLPLSLFPENCQLNYQRPEIRQIPDVDAAVVMGHNLKFDEQALRQLNQQKHLKYLGLLGPQHRKETLLARIAEPLNHKCFGPVGLDIGGNLPEEVALSCLSQIQAVIHGKMQ
ncbi:XdhC family protein [Gayadomonas joobiniege]|uniref:XdhC family protein n=1 Tax=Gayadomonas joobiniege TaxID=1234606 RepID=UPI00035DF8C5|nr:XdhC/CoxI family protein [Gayadomonas joobiniege]